MTSSIYSSNVEKIGLNKNKISTYINKKLNKWNQRWKCELLQNPYAIPDILEGLASPLKYKKEKRKKEVTVAKHVPRRLPIDKNILLSMICRSNLSVFIVLAEGYSRNSLSALNLISTVLLQYMSLNCNHLHVPKVSWW